METLLTLNAGSSSIKFAVYPYQQESIAPALYKGQIEGLGDAPRLETEDGAGRPLDHQTLDLAGDADSQHRAALAALLAWLHARGADHGVQAVGHRVVHGGDEFAAPVRINEGVLTRLARYSYLAPLHQPHNLRGIQAITAIRPDLPQVACFDTSFHLGQPDVARHIALPRTLTENGLKRYGFHGLSYHYVAESLPHHLPPAARKRVIIAHLGNGASLCALQDGRSIATTMGFTALDGLVMGTRCGNIDPGVVLHLLDQEGMDTTRVTQLLYKESGLLGVSGISADMRTLLASPDPAAAEAVDLFCYRAIREIGSLVAALGGLDALIFTAGIGQHAAPVRARICQALGWLGLEFDTAANARHATTISTTESRVHTLVLPTDEEVMIARLTRECLRRT
ncbi:MAG: acetate/propionate family kinase [Proteobacteria bacterium]|nr:acetate/propionate family kinase [Pseudomonadota bacterium]HQR04639.1 acetate/propionate family kinase [Rhodocyclaceae bacterium]